MDQLEFSYIAGGNEKCYGRCEKKVSVLKY